LDLFALREMDDLLTPEEEENKYNLKKFTTLTFWLLATGTLLDLDLICLLACIILMAD
jgi:hypothetical protein